MLQTSLRVSLDDEVEALIGGRVVRGKVVAFRNGTYSVRVRSTATGKQKWISSASVMRVLKKEAA